MTTIRERDAEYVEALGAGYDRHEHPESECPADVDRRALLAASDALAEAARAFRGHVDFGRLRVGGREANTNLSCALSGWTEIAG